MIKIYNYLSGAIKITLNEDLVKNNFFTECLEKQIALTCSNTPLLIHSLGLEFAQDRGGRIIYGLLTSKLTPNSSDSKLLSVSYTQKNVERFYDSIILNNEHSYKGLPKEYLEAVVNGASKALSECNSFPLCNINFANAANCEVGSSRKFFELLSESIIKLIPMLNYENVSESNFAMCEEYLSKKFRLIKQYLQ